MNFTLVCTENFYGPNCDMSCLDNCTCEPGFTGEFCATSLDDCVEVECGLNHADMCGWQPQVQSVYFAVKSCVCA